MRLATNDPILNFTPPEDGDYILTKRHSSAFIGTELQQILQYKGIDTVVNVGCSTSGCVRQTAVDANAYGFRSIVVSDATGDRSWDQHRANLIDLDGKYSDVMTSEEVIDQLRLTKVDREAKSVHRLEQEGVST